ncbi:MAG TPA: rhodanese-like domain-containing protein [Alloacidobacterium sp.]|nr:rhodanese-like domain-containing protein [Alloacidobacterium sp.]
MEPVRIEQFFLGCLAHASYMVGSQGVAAVVDPQRDVDIYIDAAKEAGWRIEHIIETHLHADFVSGHHELAERTGARIYLGEGSGATFPHTAVKGGDSIRFGNCRFDFLQTPGHTMESVCAVLTDLAEPAQPRAVFTGDTLFVGDVGRPDLSGDHSPPELAAMLYTSLHETLLKLPDETEVFPAHGAGSLCGRQMSAERSSTIGRERRTNYALQAKSADEFVQLLTESLPPRPEYFVRDVELNRQGASMLDDLPHPVPLEAREVLRLQSAGAVVLDTRPAMEFAVAHVPGSVHIALSGQYASWAARLLGLDKRIILVGEDAEHLRESQLRLARVGIEHVEAYLKDGIGGWLKGGYELEYMPQVSAVELAQLLEHDRIAVLDVREPAEVQSGAIEGSIRIPLGLLPARTGELDREKLLVVHCKSGYRSSIATSILRRAGFREVANLTGGYDAWAQAQTEPADAKL